MKLFYKTISMTIASLEGKRASLASAKNRGVFLKIENRLSCELLYFFFVTSLHVAISIALW